MNSGGVIRSWIRRGLVAALLALTVTGLLAPSASAASKQPPVPQPPNPVDWVSHAVSEAIGAFFKSIVTAALNPLLDLLSTTILATPTPEQLPRVGALWTNSWQIMLACYAILITGAGIVVMAHESVQTRYSIKEVGPRIAVAFLAAAMSLPLASKGIHVANALSEAVMGGGVEAGSAGKALRDLVIGEIGHDPFSALVGMALVAMLLAVLITYVVRVALTMIMVAGAPLALMCHALPQTDGIARWWWKIFGGLLAIQVAQALALITAMRLFLGPDGYALFGSSQSGLVNLIVGLGLAYVLVKIPFWILGSARISHHRSLVGGIARAYVLGAVLHTLRGGAHVGTAAARTGHTSRTAASTPRTAQAVGTAAPAAQAAPARLALRRPPGHPLFHQPGQSTVPPGHAIGPPGMPTFREPDGGAPSAAATPRPTTPPGEPLFLSPIEVESPHTPSRRPGPPPGEPRFQPPVLPRPSHPRRATQPPPPAPFRSPMPEIPHRPLRARSAPPPPLFSSPPQRPQDEERDDL